MLLFRHLVNEPRLRVEIVPRPPSVRIVRRLNHRPIHSFLNATETLLGGRAWDAAIRRHLASWRPDLIVTVAHGDACFAAGRIAQEADLPLVTFFHDWWPDVPMQPAQIHTLADRRFRLTYQQSRVALCVSDGIRQALGAHPDSEVLFPIPAPGRTSSLPRSPVGRSPTPPFKLIYLGNLGEYGPMLGSTLSAFAEHENLRLEVRGASPRWPRDFRKRMRSQGLWLDFAPRSELDPWIDSADAYLVVMAFDPGLHRRMQTSFPSKLPEYAQFGKPLVVWGPADSSAILWGRDGKALCVTTKDPASLAVAIQRLADDATEQHRLAREARRAAEGEFDPRRLQTQFLQALQRAIDTGGRRGT